MSHKRASASTADRTFACPAWLELPHVETDPGYPARRGTAIHGYVAGRYHGVDALAALRAVPEESRKDCAAVDVEPLFAYLASLTGVRFRTEVALAYDVETDTGVELGENLGREYGELPDSTMPGATDFFAIDGEAGYVVDVKTGQDVSPPEVNGQLLSLAVAAARAFGLSFVHVALAYHSGQTGEWRFLHVFYTSIDIDNAADKMRAAYVRRLQARAAVAGATVPEVHPGDHCRWCPAALSCPDKVALVRNLPTELMALDKANNSGLLTYEQLGAAWPEVQRWKQAIERIEDGIKEVARDNPLPLPNGKRLVMVEQAREYIAADAASAVLAEHYGADVAARATKASASKESIRTAVGRDQFDHAMMLIRAAGAVDVKVSLVPREEKIK